MHWTRLLIRCKDAFYLVGVGPDKKEIKQGVTILICHALASGYFNRVQDDYVLLLWIEMEKLKWYGMNKMAQNFE